MAAAPGGSGDLERRALFDSLDAGSIIKNYEFYYHNVNSIIIDTVIKVKSSLYKVSGKYCNYVTAAFALSQAWGAPSVRYYT